MAAPCTLTSLAEEGKVEARFILDEDERPKVAYNQFSDDIPVISLDGIEDDSPGGRREVICKKISEACEVWGMFQVVDHGVDPKLVDAMATLSRQFFALPAEEKLKYDMKNEFHRGGFLVSSHLKDEVAANWREMMAFIPYPIKDRDYTRWPEKPKEWRAVTEAYGEKLMDLGHKLLDILSEAMGLERDAMVKACKQMAQRMSVNLYPPCPAPNLALGLTRHHDPSTITILLQDQVGGLQTSKDDGQNWITVQPIEGAFVVNLGKHACYLSNGRFKSADHRAVVNYEHSRLSIATFINADKEAIVYPLKIEVGEKPILEEPITFAEMYRIHFINQVEQAKIKHLAHREQKLLKNDLENVPQINEGKDTNSIEETLGY